jgi:hypothetical protein
MVFFFLSISLYSYIFLYISFYLVLISPTVVYATYATYAMYAVCADDANDADDAKYTPGACVARSVTRDIVSYSFSFVFDDCFEASICKISSTFDSVTVCGCCC